MISLDSETTGLDLHHGARPFLVTICDEEGVNTWWEWEVDPLDRTVLVPCEDLTEIQKVIDSTDEIVLQNAKFDYAMLQATFYNQLRWDWSKVRDTLMSGHLLASNQPHDLGTMAMIDLRLNIQPYEDRLKQSVREAQTIAKRLKWRVACKGLKEMPSAKEKVWKYDGWIPKQIAEEEGYESDHPWRTVSSTYGNGDSLATIGVHKVHMQQLKERGLEAIYRERLKVIPAICRMEDRGVTLSSRRLEEKTEEYQRESDRAGRLCLGIARSYDYDLALPKSGANNSLREFVFDRLGLVSSKKSAKTGEPSMDKDVLDHWLTTLPEQGKALKFIQSLGAKRKRDTALTYMESYRRFWLPLPDRDWFVLYPSLNATGTDTLRFSSQNPNEQNISSKEGFNLRYCFGPAPGREWYSADAKNIELRIPAYESGEKEMIQLFDRPDDPPYFGSYHLLVCHILRPKQWDECERDSVSFKDKYPTEYGYTKNFNFADQYGAVLKMSGEGTADRAAHIHGAQRKVRGRLKKIAQLGQRMIAHAEKYGYVETMPDQTVDPDKGYPLLCTRSRWGKIKPTVPLNYHVQGTAMWWMMKAMIRVQKYLNQLNRTRKKGRWIYMIMQVHDELVFDFPKEEDSRRNVRIMGRIRRLMEQGGKDIGLPTPVSVEHHPETWDKGITI